jgi:hypothetical protein
MQVLTDDSSHTSWRQLQCSTRLLHNLKEVAAWGFTLQNITILEVRFPA